MRWRLGRAMKSPKKWLKLALFLCLCSVLTTLVSLLYTGSNSADPSRLVERVKRSLSIAADDDGTPDRRRVDVLLFSSWVSSAQKDRGSRLIFSNWRSWFPFITPLVFTGDDQVNRSAGAAGWQCLPETRNPACGGPPLLPPMFIDARRKYDAKFYGFANGDIVFGDNLKTTLEYFINNHGNFDRPVMIVGRRTNFDFHSFEKDFLSTNDIQHYVDILDEAPKSTDYFFTTQDFPWEEVIPLSIGRPTFCRWIMSYARKMKAIVVDATATVAALHLTTEDGVKSSWHIGGEGLHCNEDVIEKYRAMGVILSLGWVECQLYETYWDTDTRVQLRQRKAAHPKCPKPYAD